MFNVAVVNVKDVVKYLVSIIITLIVIMFLARYFSNKEDSGIKLSSEFLNNSLLICLDETIPAIEETNKELNGQDTEDIILEESVLEKLLKIELSMFNYIDESKNDNNNHIDVGITEAKNDSVIKAEEIQTEVKTEVVTQNPLPDTYNKTYSTVKIKNETNFELTDEILNPNIEVNSENIIIFHTHTCESYTQSEKYNYEPTGNFRTTDNNYSVVRVGNELTSYLMQYGYNVIHDTTYHDYPTYTGSYNRSLTTVQNILNTTSSDIIIDLHRDAIGSNSSYAPTVKIADEEASQLMFVIGTNGGGLWHPNWNLNLKFALKVQEKANEMYPGLFKPIILRNSRYNQHLGKAACIIEVGATGNTMDQCLVSMKYLSKVLDEVLKN